MKLLSVLFFVASVLSVILAVAAFLGKLSEKRKETGIILLIASGIFGLCELICIWNSPKGLILVICGVILAGMLLVIAQNNEN